MEYFVKHPVEINILAWAGMAHMLLGIAAGQLGAGASAYGMGMVLTLVAAVLAIDFQNMVDRMHAEMADILARSIKANIEEMRKEKDDEQ
jgi:hypothetical protein